MNAFHLRLYHTGLEPLAAPAQEEKGDAAFVHYIWVYDSPETATLAQLRRDMCTSFAGVVRPEYIRFFIYSEQLTRPVVVSDGITVRQLLDIKTPPGTPVFSVSIKDNAAEADPRKLATYSAHQIPAAVAATMPDPDTQTMPPPPSQEPDARTRRRKRRRRSVSPDPAGESDTARVKRVRLSPIKPPRLRRTLSRRHLVPPTFKAEARRVMAQIKSAD